MWLILTAISIIFRASYGVLTKILSNKIPGSAYTQTALLTIGGIISSLFLYPLFVEKAFIFMEINWLTISLVILSQGFGVITYFAAIKNLTNSTAQISFSSILIFNTILAVVFMGLKLSMINIFGVVLLGTAILSVTFGKIDIHNPKAITLMIFSAFLFSIFQLSSSELSQQAGPVAYLIISYMGGGIVAISLKGKIIINEIIGFKNKKHAFGLAIITALPNTAYFACAYFAYRMADDPPKVAILLTGQVVLTVFLSYLFLGEKDHMWRKIGAAVLIVISAALIKG